MPPDPTASESATISSASSANAEHQFSDRHRSLATVRHLYADEVRMTRRLGWCQARPSLQFNLNGSPRDRKRDNRGQHGSNPCEPGSYHGPEIKLVGCHAEFCSFKRDRPHWVGAWDVGWKGWCIAPGVALVWIREEIPTCSVPNRRCRWCRMPSWPTPVHCSRSIKPIHRIDAADMNTGATVPGIVGG